MQKLRSGIRAGQRVHVRGEAWLLVRRESFDDCALVTLRGAGDENHGETATFLTPFDELRVPAEATGLVRRSRRTVLATVARAAARAHRWTDLWAAATAAIDLHAWQLEPARAVIAGATRVVLADEVGLGKTIQAGLILTELRARHLATRALVLTPASLREQWAAELEDRFGLAPLIVDHAALARLVADLPVGVNPWSTAELVISSIDLVKRSEVRTAVDAVPFDVLVIDEAHHLRPGTDRGAVAAELAARVPWVVFATATPHSGDERAYSFLCGLGQLSSGEPLQVFRRSAAAVGQARDRRVRVYGVGSSPLERALLVETLAYAQAIWHLQPREPHAAMLASVICRRAVSSPRAVLRTLARRRELVGLSTPASSGQADLPWGECDAADGLESDEILASACLGNREHEIDRLDRLIDLARSVSADAAKRSSPVWAKAAVIERLLRRTGEAVLVFSEYRDTVAALEERLASCAALAVLHGGMSARERRDAILKFTSARARVLLATDAAGEGLNLHERCRLVVNVELPWNPQRLEQRIGRVDRLGQRRRVHALHLFHRGSFEDEVLVRLQRRMETAAHELDRLAIDERRVAAAVFDGLSLPAGPARAPSQPARVATPDRAGAVTLRRRARAIATSTLNGTSPVCAAPVRRHRLSDRFALLFELDVHDGGGRLVARELLPLVVELWRRVRVDGANVRQFSALLASSPGVHAVLDRQVGALLVSTRAELGRTAAAVERRLLAMADRIELEPPALVQASLFDRRAEQLAGAREATIAARRAHVQQRLADVRTLSPIDASSAVRLVAVWPAPSGIACGVEGPAPSEARTQSKSRVEG